MSSSVGKTAIFSASRRLFFSGGGGKPSWSIPKEQMWHPQIPDRQYYGEHPTYNGFVLFIRGIRPYLEKIFEDTFKSGKNLFNGVYTPMSNFVRKHNPDIRLQLVALTAFGVTSGVITHYFGNYYQSLVDVTTLTELGASKDLDDQGFWLSQSQDMENRIQNYSVDHERLNNLWETALEDATLNRSFDTLIKHLQVDENEISEGVPPRISFRFNMLPYGNDNPDTQTFPIPSYEQPLRGFALNFTYNNLMGDWGDYIDRKDNKNAIIRPARSIFTDVYIPGTK